MSNVVPVDQDDVGEVWASVRAVVGGVGVGVVLKSTENI
jgi:hypothetical protein